MKRHIGIYSGSFDPVHQGHIAFAKEAARVCELSSVVFMPERFPRGKPNVSPISERLTELEIALATTPFEALNAHADQFTVDETLLELEALYPETTFTFLIGSDVALNLPNWENIEALVQHSDFAVGLRDGDSIEEVQGAMESVRAKWVQITTSFSHLSSKQIRQAN